LRAASLNRGEFVIGHGLHKSGQANAIGMEGAGTVVELGANVTGLAIGDKVMGRCKGAFAEYACMDVREAIPMPECISYEQADLTVHGGPDKAIYAYPVEHYDFWEKTLEQNDCGLGTLGHGFFGENLTIEGFSEDEVFVGDLWQIGEVELMVENLREPCFKFTGKIGYPDAGPVMVRTARSGWYLSVLQPGTLKAGDPIQVTPGDREVSIAMQNALLKIKRKL